MNKTKYEILQPVNIKILSFFEEFMDGNKKLDRGYKKGDHANFRVHFDDGVYMDIDIYLVDRKIKAILTRPAEWGEHGWTRTIMADEFDKFSKKWWFNTVTSRYVAEFVPSTMTIGEGANSYMVGLSCGGLMEMPEFEYSDIQVVMANSPEEATDIYNKVNNCDYFYGHCLAELK